MIFCGTQDSNQKFKLYYGHVDPNMLICGLNRGESWYKDHHKGWSVMLERLCVSIHMNGMLMPLSVLYDKGKFKVFCGGQRLAAAKKLGCELVPCVVAFKVGEEENKLFGLKQIESIDKLNGLYHMEIDRINLANNSFEILVKDRKQWDPNNLLER